MIHSKMHKIMHIQTRERHKNLIRNFLIKHVKNMFFTSLKKKTNIKRESPRLRVVHQHHEELRGGGFRQIAVPQGLILRWRERLL